MRGWVRAGAGLVVALTVVLSGLLVSEANASPKRKPLPGVVDRATGTGSYVLPEASTGSGYAAAFTGNGLLGVRVPRAGQGYVGGSVPALSELAGFYAQPPGQVQQRANIPTWTTLTFSDGGQPFTPVTGGWDQWLDLHTGIVTTFAHWRAPDGHITDITYEVLTNRANPHVGLVHLQLTPHWSGTATVTDEIDGTPATMTTQLGKGWDLANRSDWVSVRTEGTGITAGLASELSTSANVNATDVPVDQTKDQSVGQQLSFPVSAGHVYVIQKFVGVETSQDSGNPTGAAQGQASSAALAGSSNLFAANDAAWASLWRGRIDIIGDSPLATDVNASQFYLWASANDGIDWSIPPAGLSSNADGGNIFWDAETWMLPALLAQHPGLAAGINAYRFQRLAAAEQHAAATGYQGARYPWESALDGSEQVPPPASVNSEGQYEQHITADVALAQWQYFLATDNRAWLASQGWPVLSAAATFWASRVSRASDGSYRIDGVTGPDEENSDVNDEAYTNAAARATLLDATRAAQVLGIAAPSSWSQIASGLVVPRAAGIHPEYAGYQGELVKQADVTLLQYPLGYPMSAGLAASDINYYVPRTDPSGPSISDAVNSIDTSALGMPGCASFVYTERSYQPFIHGAFDQFSATRSSTALTSMTGIGGFLQQFLYGYSGLRWGRQAVSLEPVLTSQLGGIVLRNLRWHGRVFTIAIGPRTSTLTLISGHALWVHTRFGRRHVRGGHVLVVRTLRPDLQRSRDLVRCQRVKATSAQAGATALAAVDGSPATDWQPASLPANLTVGLAGGDPRIRAATLRWGRAWPPQPAPNVHPPAGPVTVVRPSSYELLASRDGKHWRVLASVRGRASDAIDVLRFGPVRARFVRVRITGSSASEQPMLDELTVTR